MNTSEAQFNVVSPEELARQRKDWPRNTERAVVLDTGTVQIDLNRRRPEAFKGRQLGGVAARAALRIDRPAFNGELTQSEGMAGFPEADTLTAPLPSSGSLLRKPGGPLWGVEKLAHKAAVNSGNELPLEVDGVVLMTHKESGTDVK